MRKKKEIIIFGLLMLMMSIGERAIAQVNIWEGERGHKKVEMTLYLAPGENRIAVIVCPGGSYFWHDMKNEGDAVGRWLQAQGISAFVLRYRTAYVPAFLLHYRYLVRGNRYPDPQDDLLQALRYVKRHHEVFGIDSLHIGVMGFSAGGHLVMSAAEFFDGSDKPTFVAAIYPVVTMTEECVHKRSRRALLGESRMRNRQMRDSLSLERHVPEDCPPVFLVNCKDDPVVDSRNSVLLDSALTARHIPHRYLQYARGGHGFGASDTKGSAECREWKNEFIHWLQTLASSW